MRSRFRVFQHPFFRNQRGWLTAFWGQSRFQPGKNRKTWIRADFGIMVGLWRISASLNLEFKKSWGRDFTKRRILARIGPEYAERGTKKISPRRNSRADMHSTTLELRGSWEEKKKASSWGWWCREDKKMVEVTKKNIATIFEVKNLSPRFFPPIFFYGKALEFSKIFDETEKKSRKLNRNRVRSTARNII